MAQSAVIREEFCYAGHNAVVHAVCYNRVDDCFLSSDDAHLRLWTASSPSSPDRRVVALPPRTARFVQALAFVEARHVYVAAALDGTLKLYDHALNEVASVFTARGAIQSLAFDSAHSRLLAGGVDGVAAWDVRGKPLLGPEAVLNPQYDFAAAPGFFHYATSSKAAPAAVAVAVAAPTKPAAAAKRALRPNELSWVQSVQLNREQTRVYAHSRHRMDVFAASDGRHVDAFPAPVPVEHGAVTAFTVHEKTQYLVCGCLDGTLVVLSVHPTAVVHVFKDHTLAVTGLAVHRSSQLILSSSLDGTVRLWDLEARRQAHRLDIRQPVHELALLAPPPMTATASSSDAATSAPCRFYVRTRSAVQLFTIQSAAKEHLSSLAPISVLQRVGLPTARAVFAREADLAIPGETHSPTRRLATLALPATSELEGDEDDTDRIQRETQWIVAAGTDRTVRLFSGRAANEAPSFTWIPEEHALDVSGLSLHPVGRKLFLLLESQKLLVVDIRKRTTATRRRRKTKKNKRLANGEDGDQAEEENEEEGDDEGGLEEEEERPRRHRLVDMDAAPLSILGSNKLTGATPLKKSVAALAATQGEKPSSSSSGSSSSNTGLNGATNVAANPALRGAVRCICCCYYPPIFRAAATSASAAVVSGAGGGSGGSGGDVQLKWFSRTFVNRRQQSKRDLKRVGDLTTAGASSPSSPSSSPTKGDGAPPLLQSDREWVVCGSEFGHLVFWHSGLSNSFQEAISLDAHDAGVVAIAASASSPLCVSLDAGRRVHIWQFQPVFLLRQVVELHEHPSCFCLSPTSELLLTGYEDGAVVLMRVGDALAQVETLGDGGDERHDAMVSGADFLDAKLLVLTASVDAVVKIWDQHKNLLRQIRIAMALTCLCFMNDDGDVMAGVPTGIFMLSKDDLLPDKLPAHDGAGGSPGARHKKRPFWLGGEETGSDANSPTRDASSSSPAKSTSVASPPKSSVMVTAPPAALKGKNTFQNKPAVSFSDGLPGGEEPDARDRGEADASSPPSSPPARPPVAWKRRNFNGSLSLLMGGSGRRDGATDAGAGEKAAALQALHPPVLRPLQTANQNQNQRPTPPARPPSSRTMFPAKDPDWREVIMPSSPRHGGAAANPFAGRNRRLKPPTESSAIIAELRALAHASPPPSTARGSPPKSTELSEPTPAEANEPLGIGPLQYCKHQAPVPPKAKTPRKLWNAIGGEDRRLLAVQRNLPSLT